MLIKTSGIQLDLDTPVTNDFTFTLISCRIQPLKLPNGLPSEEEMAGSYLNSKGELVIKRPQMSAEQKTMES